MQPVHSAVTDLQPSGRPRSPSTCGDPSLYLNRELSWLEFNRRVLHEALDPRTPLLERLKFLGIFSSNLDEFFQVRVAGLKRQVAAGIVERTADGMTPEEQLRAIAAMVRELVAQHRRCLMRRACSRRWPSTGVHAHPATRRSSAGRPRAPRPLLPRQRLPGADAARRGSGASLPLHLEPESLARGGAPRRGRRGALRPGEGAEDPAALGAAARAQPASCRWSR